MELPCRIMLLQTYFLEKKNISFTDNVDQDQTASSLQSDLDLHWPHEVSASRLAYWSQDYMLHP